MLYNAVINGNLYMYDDESTELLKVSDSTEIKPITLTDVVQEMLPNIKWHLYGNNNSDSYHILVGIDTKGAIYIFVRPGTVSYVEEEYFNANNVGCDYTFSVALSSLEKYITKIEKKEITSNDILRAFTSVHAKFSDNVYVYELVQLSAIIDDFTKIVNDLLFVNDLFN